RRFQTPHAAGRPFLHQQRPRARLPTRGGRTERPVEKDFLPRSSRTLQGGRGLDRTLFTCVGFRRPSGTCSRHVPDVRAILATRPAAKLVPPSPPAPAALPQTL